jgi:hypothetical protein
MVRPSPLLLSSILVTILVAPAGCSRDNAIELPDGLQVLAESRGDLDGDGREETVRLVGRRAEDSPFCEDLALAVEPAWRLWPLPTAAATGYAPELRLTDLTGDDTEEILLTADTGGSGGLVNAAVVIASREGEVWSLRRIYDAQSGPVPTLEGALTDGFAARLEITAPGFDRREETLDLSSRRSFYLETGIYDEDGKLLREVPIWGDALMAVAPLSAAAGGPGLQITQQPRGAANADRLAEVRTLLVWRDDRWEAIAVYVLPLD